MATPVTIVESGGLPITNTVNQGAPMTPVDAGGLAVTLVDSGGLPVTLVEEDGTLWEEDSGGEWSPTDLGASLLAWWSADRSDLITLSGSAVTSWRDAVAAYDAVQAVGASRPVYSATSFNGSPGVTFDGTDDELTATNPPLPSGANPCEVWVLADQTSLPAVTGTKTFLCYGNVSVNTSRRVSRTVVTAVNRANTLLGTGAGTSTVADASVDLSGRHVIRCAFGATATAVSVDAQTAASVPAVPSTTIDKLRLGANTATSASLFGTMVLREAIITGALTTEQAGDLSTYLQAKRNP